MQTVVVLACLLGVAGLASAHLCLVEPKQRGSIMGLDKAVLLILYVALCYVFRMKGKAVLQVQYVPKNPQAPAVFYQCSDIMIH
ncbi:hypothetical protein MAR_001527 [Mya arenaria]|nr:hypothetical protein MAR_001527 [Mya arenaria]